jgi:broad specificity phosphatase PhoE
MSDLTDRLRAMPSSLNDACRTMEEAADRLAEMEGLSQFLVDRLEEFDPGDDEPEREFHGHVAPAAARLRDALNPKAGS